MLTAIYSGANKEKKHTRCFLTNNDQLTRQNLIIIIETSMSDYNIIQIEANIKIAEEKPNHQIKKSNLSYSGKVMTQQVLKLTSIDAKHQLGKY